MQRETGRQQILHASVRIGSTFSNLFPTAVGSFKLQHYLDSTGGSALRCVEHVGSDGAHFLISFSNLSRVILLCSSDAITNSVSGSFCKRLFRDASISSVDLPLAQMMKMKPKRSIYFRLPSASAALVSAAASRVPTCSCADHFCACSD